jgi:Holliday junction resolvase RusA-like endonuclease
MTADIVLTIQAPPSANRLYRNFGGRMVKSPVYRAWKDAQADAIAHQLGGARIDGHFRCSIVLPKSRMDLDNRAKPLLDAMQQGGAYRDDKLCMALNMAVDHAREPGTVLVHLWSEAAPPKPRPKPKASRLKMAVPVQPL